MNQSIISSYYNKPIRQSNFELLRIVAMFLVLITHADFFSTGIPDRTQIIAHPLSTYVGYIVESLTLVCVNVYILISGYFEIKTRTKSVLAFVFLVLFWRILIIISYKLLPYVSIDTNQFSNYEMLRLCIPGYKDWFVTAYVLLLFLSPILNSYIHDHSANELKKFVFYYMVFQFLFAWLIPVYGVFKMGYSALSFIGLYLTGATLKKYQNINLKIRKPLLWYFIISIAVGSFMYLIVIFCGSEHIKQRILGLFEPYNGPFIYAASVMMFLAFKNFKIQSKFINYIAASSFAVYLMHMNPLMCGYYSRICKYLYVNFGGMSYFIRISSFIILVFTTAIIIDQLRRYIWNHAINIFFSRYHN